jgi:prepilin-type N-terminal cleavage/methylation domain-containing protein
MKMQRHTDFKRKGFTLLEMSIVIMVLLALIKTGFVVSSKMDQWKRGRTASETLRSVYTAQRMLLADNPTKAVSTIVAADLFPYMPGPPTALPTIQPMSGANLSIKIDVSPPIIDDGSGLAYDPSGCSTDSLWDVGE